MIVYFAGEGQTDMILSQRTGNLEVKAGLSCEKDDSNPYNSINIQPPPPSSSSLPTTLQNAKR